MIVNEKYRSTERYESQLQSTSLSADNSGYKNIENYLKVD